MRIEQIEVFTLRIPHHYRIGGHQEAPGRMPGTDYYFEPQWRHAYSSITEACLVKVTCADGTVGWGETQAPLTPETPCALITTLLGPALLGQNALATSVLYDRMYHLMLARGHSASFWMDAIAGLDNALWDLRGQHSKAPIFELLGGPYRLSLPGYVSGLRVKTLEERVAAAKHFHAHGFAGVKIFTGGTVPEAIGEARAIRAVLPQDCFFALDAICKYSAGSARHIGACLDDLQATWFEAPVNADDIRGHATLAQSLATPIAVGETLRTPRQFEPWLRVGALAIAQPDIMRTGITGALRIAALADAFYVPTTLHIGVCTGIGMAATWQAAAALPGDIPQEHQHDLFESAQRTLRTKLTETNGILNVPQEPGIGVQVDEQAILEMSTAHWLVDSNGRRLVEAPQ
jgi:L-alanine-DL-glutamate epimerase-like enolase superfamily enzyme